MNNAFTLETFIEFDVDEILATCPLCGHVARFTFYGRELEIDCPDFSCPNNKDNKNE